MVENMSLDLSTPAAQRLHAPGKKRILTIDGGGVRGIVALAFLKELESQLRAATGRSSLVLADVFDLVAGTSVGSMLATMVSLGLPVNQMELHFRDMAPKIFAGRPTIFGQKRFSPEPLAEAVRKIAGDATLGSPKLLTGLAIIAKRVDTGAVWVMINNPATPYYEDGTDEFGAAFIGNKRYTLETLIRASTAAPFLFTPAAIEVHPHGAGRPSTGWFVDGGVSPHNNPALQMLLMAALPAYRLNWTLSPDDLMMISIGTGMHRARIDPKKKALDGSFIGSMLTKHLREDIEEAAFAASTLRSMVADSVLFSLQVMQSVANPRFSWKINGEIGDLHNELLLQALKGLPGGHHDPRGLLTFQRYDLPLDDSGLVPPEYDVVATQAERSALHAIDDATIIDPLSRLASEAARKQVSLHEFEGFLSQVAR